ncbi:hypothetical protein [Deinococcus sp.]|uniref:hypothetical protein n=1 Tax=Deinococcus sp. TaxID=47478 RepID=UPI0025BAAFCC|nr:hypothetical protein [Deinococcus sp.]
MTRFLSRLLFVLAASGASALGAAQAATVSLTLGQTATLGSASVTLLRAQDSRCPINARCVRAGELKVSVLSVQGGRTRLLHLQLPASSNDTSGLRVVGATRPLAGQPTREPLTVTLSGR